MGQCVFKNLRKHWGHWTRLPFLPENSSLLALKGGGQVFWTCLGGESRGSRWARQASCVEKPLGWAAADVMRHDSGTAEGLLPGAATEGLVQMGCRACEDQRGLPTSWDRKAAEAGVR